MVEILTIWPWLNAEILAMVMVKIFDHWPWHPDLDQMVKKVWSPYPPPNYYFFKFSALSAVLYYIRCYDMVVIITLAYSSQARRYVEMLSLYKRIWKSQDTDETARIRDAQHDRLCTWNRQSSYWGAHVKDYRWRQSYSSTIVRLTTLSRPTLILRSWALSPLR